MVKIALALSLALALAGCQTLSGDFCDVSEAHPFSDAAIAAMTKAEAARELAHNDKGARFCGWKPRRGGGNQDS